MKKNTNQFNWMEFSGSLGDLGLFIPLVVAMTIACDLNIGVILIWAGLLNILTGWLFKQPIPVQPMKAIAAVAITEELLKSELFASGIIMGIILIGCSFFIDRINQFVPKVVVRGIQLGIGLKLAVEGIKWITALPVLGADSVVMALFIICALMLCLYKGLPVLIFIFLFGFLILFWENNNIASNIIFRIPEMHFFWPDAAAFRAGLMKGAIPQLPLTLLNSVIAVCALSSDYFPGRGISTRKMALSVGLMNCVSVPFGGIPVCHGSGGLAAQYRFGARTGGSVILLGAGKILIGLLFGSALIVLLKDYPMAVLAPMLILAGLELASKAKDCFTDKPQCSILLITTVFILGSNTFFGFLAGISVYALLSLQKSHQ